MNDVTAIVRVFYVERFSYLPRIVESIREAGIERVIVWNNNPSEYVINPILGVDEIRSTFNTIMGQFAAAFLAATPTIYYQDDDLVVSPETIVRMRALIDNFRPWLGEDHFVTLSGAMLKRDSSRAYTDSTDVVGPCDVMVGRCWMARKSILIDGMSRSLRDNFVDPGCNAEDLYFSFGHTYALADPEFTNLDEQGTGLRFRADHLEQRDRIARELLKSCV